MSYKFNPFTGTFDYFEAAISSGVSFYGDNKTVDAAFLLDKKITLTATPLASSELVYLNGLLMGSDCYAIIGTELTFQPAIPFKVGHFIDIRYAA